MPKPGWESNTPLHPSMPCILMLFKYDDFYIIISITDKYQDKSGNNIAKTE